MKKVLLRAPLLTNSGYGVHSRQIFKWLEQLDIDLTVECLRWGKTSWTLDEKKENGIFKRIMERAKPLDRGSYDLSLQVQLPNEWDNSLAKFNIGITAAVETDKCSPKWIEDCNKMDQIIVPSTFTKNVIKRSGPLKTPIFVVQEWFDQKILSRSLIDKTLNDKRFDFIKTNFNILVIAQITSINDNTDRKNLINTIKWCYKEFENNPDVGIVIKTNFGKGTESDKDLTRKFLKQRINEFRKNNGPKIYLVHGNLSTEEVFALYQHKKMKMFALATRGEGYGLPLIEAAASGLPIVTTNWSGHLEFLKKDLFYPVDYSLRQVEKEKIDNHIFIEGHKWAEPSEASFKKQIREVYNNYDNAKSKSKKLKDHVLKNYNSAIIKKLYNDVVFGGKK